MQMREKTSPSPQRQYVRSSHQKQHSSSIQHTPEGILLRVPGGNPVFTMKHNNKALTNNFCRNQSRKPNTTSETIGSEQSGLGL